MDGSSEPCTPAFSPNDTAAAYPRERRVHELFEAQVERVPEAIALVCGARRLTYRELNDEADRLARFLRQHGAGPDQLIGLCVERSADLVIGLLGILKSGAAYVPLDPHFPAERVQYMLQSSGARIIVTQVALQEKMAASASTVIAIDAPLSGSVALAQNVPSPVADVSSRNLAYVIFTSGSTGTPKGVMVEHRSVVNFLTSMQRAPGIAATDRLLAVTTISFDIAALEIFLPLVSGAQVVLASRAAAADAVQLIELIDTHDITVLQATPVTWRMLLGAGWKGRSTLRAFCGGEALTADLSSRLRDKVESLWNLYGPTETTIWSSCLDIEVAGVQGAVESIGRPIANTRIHILDTSFAPVSGAAEGEIFIAGDGVARGYFGRPELTRERFLPDPFSARPDARMYRTGDLARWRADGTIEYLGRNDHQVKIRGFRIELGEIEARLAQQAGVEQAVVIAREDVPAEKRLVAYITSRAAEPPAVDDLRGALKAVLPDYMVPSALVLLPEFPLTPNGKVDRRALPAPGLDAYARRRYEAPQGEREEVLAGIWQELLGLARVGRLDNFFELGGHSLLTVQMLEKLASAGLSAEVARLFESATLADMAAVLTVGGDRFEVPPNKIPRGCHEIAPDMLPLVDLDVAHIRQIVEAIPGGAGNVQDIYPLTPLQEGMLFHHILDDRGGDTYVMPTVLSLESRDRVEELIAALQRVIDRHDIMRTAMLWQDLPRPVQIVCREVTLPVEQIELDRSRDALEQIEEWMQPGNQRLELWRAPLMHLKIAADTRSDRWYALLQVHHIVDDAVSLRILISEVVAHLQGCSRQLAEPVPYRNHVAYTLARAQVQDSEQFFRKRLSDVTEPTAPFGLLDVHGDGSRISEAHKEMDADLSQRVRIQARRLNVSVATLFHAAWALVVAHTSGVEDVVFGSVLLGRLQATAGAQRILGMFVNTLPLRVRLSKLSAAQLIEHTHRELVELVNHEQASLAVAQRCSGIEGSAPLFSAVINYRHSPIDPESEWASVRGVRVIARQYRTNYPITLSIDDLGENFSLVSQTDNHIKPARIAEYLCIAMHSLVSGLEQDPQTAALALSILPADEYERVVHRFNATQASYPQDRLVHELFTDQVQRTPNAIAVIGDDETLSYHDLNERANKLARFLRDNGVSTGEYVPIVMPRSLRMLVAQLAVLKCGAAYVPVDPSLPPERQAFMIRDCNSGHVVADDEPCEGLAVDSVQWINCTRLSARIGEMVPEDMRLALTSDHPAYVMFTSGSTGTPKGVIVPHRAISRLVINNGYARLEPSDCIAHSSNPAFDASTFEIWGALLVGARVLLVDQTTVLEASRYADLLLANNVTVLWITVGLLAQYTDVLAPVFERLRYLLTGGDVVDPEMLRRVLRNGPPQNLLSAYGPTECTTFTTTYRVVELSDDVKAIPIGRPIANAQVYILDRDRRPVPVGVVGELYIGGAGVGLGYLNRPELTAERFVADPFSGDPHGRLYKSGDLARWRSDGNVEFLGRSDQQVKLRGFRIELGEIEACLMQSPQVREAAVVARSSEQGEKHLVAYVVADTSHMKDGAESAASDDVGAEVVAHWKTLYEETYSTGSLEPSFVGWNSSYTGEPIPEHEMQEWLDSTVARIHALRPERVLEIGCGLGLILDHIAPDCARYVATDFSDQAVTRLRSWLRTRPELQHVELIHGAAHELQGLEGGSFDTVILNSVVQYFPDIGYLLSVIESSTRLLAPGGMLFIGDVRNLRSLEMFHTAVQLGKAAATVSVAQLRRRIARAVAQDKELVIDPGFFYALAGRVPGIGSAEIHVKRGRASNELTRHRYDVVLRKASLEASEDVKPIEWSAIGTAASLESALRERRWDAVVLRSVPNACLTRESAACNLLARADDRTDVSAVRREVNATEASEIDRETLRELTARYGYDAIVSPGKAGFLDVRLVDRERAASVLRAAPKGAEAPKPWEAFASDPLENIFRQQLVPRLKEHLKARLPDYMVPSQWMMLKQLPLTPNGKIDRRALPEPQSRPEEMGEYVAPRTDVEWILVDIWTRVLRVDQVGVEDNFFDLGGHSLLATQVVVRIQSQLSIEMPMRLLFEYPTVRSLAVQVEQLRQDRLLGQIEAGDAGLQEILERVTSMPESNVRELLQKLRTEAHQ